MWDSDDIGTWPLDDELDLAGVLGVWGMGSEGTTVERTT